MIAQRLTARRRKKILLKQNRKRPLRTLSAAFLYPIYLSAPQKASASQALRTGIWEISMCAEASSRISTANNYSKLTHIK